MNKWSINKVFKDEEHKRVDEIKDIHVDENVINVLDSIFDRIPVSIILIDANSKILMISKSFANFLGVTKEEAKGKTVDQINRNTRFPYVMERKRSEIAWKHTFQNGETAIVHRIPILNRRGEAEYGFGMVLFDNIEEFKKIIDKNQLLTNELKHYKKVLRKLQGANYSWESIIGKSDKIKQAVDIGKQASHTESTVLITGESGTGKELFAHAIHNSSPRHEYPFIKVNCGAIPYNLIEAELFGYEEGAFTGSKKGGKPGKFELAHGGSIFLDEIGELPKNMQVKLLRVLQEKEIDRLGGSKSIKVDVRIIAATNRNLLKQVEENQFREDLYYRLHVMTLEVPPLKERLSDLELLSEQLIKKIAKNLGKHEKSLDPQSIALLQEHHWPGNVRELENVLERAMNICKGDLIEPVHLPEYLREKILTSPYKEVEIPKLKDAVSRMEKQLIIKALEKTGGNKVKTAEILGISRSKLYDKLDSYKVDV